MDQIIIEGGTPLKGTVKIAGAKNAALPLMAACLLIDEDLVLLNVPHLSDISTMASLLIQHGCSFSIDGCNGKDSHIGRVIHLNATKINNFTAPYNIVRKMRASVLVLGPLLARYGRAIVSLPGGCAIGTRPIDLHLGALEKMGAKIDLEDGYIKATVDGKLKGCDITFEKISVGATENILMAATLAEGKTILRNAAQEPEVTDLAKCLIQMGAKIEGLGTNTLTITGQDSLHGAKYSIIKDRIEAGSYAIAAAMTSGEILLSGVTADLLGQVCDEMRYVGATILETPEGLLVTGGGEIKPIDLETAPYPLFPTDMQAQFMTLLSKANGTSHIKENIFENRFMHVPELNRLGANIQISDNTAKIIGVQQLKGAEVMATDLRASISLVIAGLAASGQTTINRVYHIDRGYEWVEDKLSECGAKIKRIAV